MRNPFLWGRSLTVFFSRSPPRLCTDELWLPSCFRTFHLHTYWLYFQMRLSIFLLFITLNSLHAKLKNPFSCYLKNLLTQTKQRVKALDKLLLSDPKWKERLHEIEGRKKKVFWEDKNSLRQLSFYCQTAISPLNSSLFYYYWRGIFPSRNLFYFRQVGCLNVKSKETASVRNGPFAILTNFNRITATW